MLQRRLERKQEEEARSVAEEHSKAGGGGDGGGGGSSTASPSTSSSGNSTDRIWQIFMEKATTAPGANKRPAKLANPFVSQAAVEELTMDPSAVLETPSLNELGRGLTQVRAELSDLRADIGKILRAVTKGGEPNSGAVAPAAAGPMAALWGDQKPRHGHGHGLMLFA